MDEAEHKVNSMPADYIEHLRARIAMYVGGSNFGGLVNYLVSAFDLMLDNGATWIELELPTDAAGFQLSSDAQIATRLNDAGQLEPFERPLGEKRPHRIDAMILVACAEHFQVRINNGTTETTLVTAAGPRQSLQEVRAETEPGTCLSFLPDRAVFSVTEVSPALVRGYCKRAACLHPGVVFRVKQGGETTEYRSTGGIGDFFRAVSLPYQVLHAPISICETEGDLKVEAVFVFQGWNENRIWSFANKGRVPDGGSHEAGMLDAIAHFRKRHASSAAGVLAVLAIESPNVTFAGARHAEVYNPELGESVCRLVIKGLETWVRNNPEEVEHLNSIGHLLAALA